MMEIHLLKKTPDLRAFAEIRLMSLEDGAGRGQRVLVARNSAGVAFEVAVDRGFDISALFVCGINVGWHSATQMPFPPADPSSEDGWAFLRNFDGFMVTCGLDHFGRPEKVDIRHYGHPHLTTVTAPMHGRIATSRATISSYGVDPDTGEIHCEGIVRQASVFGKTLELRRKISLPMSRNDLIVEDTVTNRGFRPARHAVLYHLNWGHPFLDEALDFSGFPDDLCADLRADRRVPSDDYGERVNNIESSTIAQSGITLRNTNLGISATLSFSTETLPNLTIWRAYQSGIFALGIEPRTESPPSQVLLNPGERQKYRLQIGLKHTRYRAWSN
ncbi:aldose 1-epimerase family protein [Pararhizobium sp.]|uniref:aldose 1-epimerase family protein n=1 Tax=Pararhizobium sp. TaxID=1977563 RepID=UPI003D140977